MYAYYERNREMLGSVIRDEPLNPVVQEVVELRFGPAMAEIGQVLAEGLPRSRSKATRAALDLALDFGTWQLLVARGGLTSRQAAEQMARATLCAAAQAA
jgi:hypothetical protein